MLGLRLQAKNHVVQSAVISYKATDRDDASAALCFEVLKGGDFLLRQLV